MVTPQEALIAQQQVAVQPSATVSLQIQQEALRTGKSVSQIQQERAQVEISRQRTEAQAREEKARTELASIDTRLENIESEFQASTKRTEDASFAKNISLRRKEQGIQKGLSAERKILDEAKRGLEQGFIVNVSQALTQSKEARRLTEGREVSKFADIERARKDFNQNVQQKTGVSLSKLSRTLGSEAQAIAFLEGRGTIDQSQFNQLSSKEQKGLGNIGIKFERPSVTPTAAEEAAQQSFFAGVSLEVVPQSQAVDVKTARGFQRESVAQSTEFLIEKGVPRFVAVTGGRIAEVGLRAKEPKEAVKLPLVGAEAIGMGIGFVETKAFEQFPEFKGFEITFPTREEKIIEVPVQQRGTIDISKPTFEEFVIPARGERRVTIFEPERVVQAGEFGGELGVFFAAPIAVIAPGLFVEGVETALDPSLSKGQRLLGVAEAELGLLGGGIVVKRLVKNLNPIFIREVSEINRLIKTPEFKPIGKRGRGGKQKVNQKTVQEAKSQASKKSKKKVTKKEVKEFLQTDVKSKQVFLKDGTTRTEFETKILKKGTSDFQIKADKARLLLRSTKTPQGRKEVLKLLDETYGRSFLQDFLQQEGINLIPELAQSRLTPKVFEITTKEQAQVELKAIKQAQKQRLRQPRVKRIPKVKQKVFDITGVDSNLAALTASAVTTAQAQAQKQEQKQVQIPGLDLKIDQQFALDQRTIQEQQQRQRLVSVPRVVFQAPKVQFIGIDFGFGPQRLEKPTKKPRIRPPFLDFEEDPVIKKIMESKKPHDVFVKTKGRRRKIADNIMGDIALDLGSNVADRSLGAEFSIKEDKGKLKDPPFLPPKDYWEFNQNKFRGFRVKKGKIIPLKNTFIEKRNRRLDTPQEVSNISVARYIAQQKRMVNEMFKVNKGFANIFGNTKGNNPSPKRKKVVRTSPKKQKARKQKNMFDIPFNLI